MSTGDKDQPKTPDADPSELSEIQLDAAVGGEMVRPCIKNIVPCVKTFIPCIKVRPI